MCRNWIIAALVACGGLCVPAASPAATVELYESRGDVNEVRLDFKGSLGEANRLTVSTIGESTDHYEIRLLDTGAGITAGSGCSGGGAPGIPVDCSVHKPARPQPIQCSKTGCAYLPGSEWRTSMSFFLGDAGSHLDAASILGSAEIPLTVTPGAGDDLVLTGDADDTIEASPGADRVRTGAGEDTFKGGPVPDGADDVDLDPGFDAVDYRERTSSIAIRDDLVANDGAPGEGDRLVGSEEFDSGSGDDVLEGSPVPAFGDLIGGGPGDDLIVGGPSKDILYGGDGDDRIYGGTQGDLIGGNVGNDRVYGGAGPDEIADEGGDDFVSGGRGHDQLKLGIGDDDAWGGGGNDDLRLGPGADTGSGGPGRDLLLGEEGRDVLAGGGNTDGLVGGEKPDSLYGGPGNDEILSGVAPRWPTLGLFLYSPGSLENERDEIECGPGGDRVGTDRADVASGCETVVRLRQLELFGVSDSPRSPAQLAYEVRTAGVVRLSGVGLKPQRQRRDPSSELAFSRLPLYPVGRARKALRRDGRVTIRAKVVLRTRAGASIARFRKVTLLEPAPSGRAGRP